jgi:hypothetical protein
MPVGFLRKPPWPRSLLMPHIRKSGFGKCSIPFSPLSAKRSMLLSVTGCDGLQPKPRTFAPGHTNAIDETAMIAVQLMSSDRSRRQVPSRSPAAMAPESARSGILPVGAPPTVTAQFRPLDAGIVNEAIPAFFIGRNKEGFWIARDVKGRIGGIFLLENSALSFARKNSRPAGCATIFPSERFELDLENNGNPLVTYLRPLMRLATPHRRRAAAFIRKMAQAITRRFKDFSRSLN